MNRMLRAAGVVTMTAVTVLSLNIADAVARVRPATTYPVNTDVVSAYATGVFKPNTPPPGANVPCQTTADHPFPVVLVHGTVENQNDNWQAASPFLANAGFCVYTFTFGGTSHSGGIDGIADIEASAKTLQTFVNQVLATTGARRVDIVGHSQGGMMPRYYLRYLGGLAKVHRLIGLVPSNNGTTLSGLGTLAGVVPGAAALLGLACKACEQQLVGSAFLRKLNATYETLPGMKYTVITTTHDEVVTPYSNAYLPPARNVRNVLWQDVCPNDAVGHVGIAYDTGVLQYVANVLAPAFAQPVTCVAGFGL